jgi:tetratricopeptide (TPR) repeat protein
MACCPDSFIAPTNLATAYGREANALRVAGEDAREAGRIEEANWMMARQREKYVKAADLLERALAVNPKSMAALHNAFMYNFRLGHYQRAVERLERLLAINDALPPTLLPSFEDFSRLVDSTRHHLSNLSVIHLHKVLHAFPARRGDGELRLEQLIFDLFR